ncbi:manganese efflux pump [Spirulina major]|uniref:manganese efflux pump n=1 Tax=Spirulina major TaxID=270636 RepID=UPI00093222F5|nr:manganese efflux pump [Spirulina major]
MIDTIVTAAILSVSTNLDNLAVGVAYGFKRLTIGWLANGAIASLSGISTLCSMSLGNEIASLISPQWAQSLGSSLLIVIGVVVLVQFWRSRHAPISPADAPPVNNGMSLRDAVLLGLALTLSNIGTGISAGMTHLDVATTSSLSLLSSLVMIGGGVWLGRLLTHQWQRCRLDWLAGLGLILLGVYASWA